MRSQPRRAKILCAPIVRGAAAGLAIAASLGAACSSRYQGGGRMPIPSGDDDGGTGSPFGGLAAVDSGLPPLDVDADAFAPEPPDDAALGLRSSSSVKLWAAGGRSVTQMAADFDLTCLAALGSDFALRGIIAPRGGTGLRRHVCRHAACGAPRTGQSVHDVAANGPRACATCIAPVARICGGRGCAMKDEQDEKPHRRTDQSAGEHIGEVVLARATRGRTG